MTNQLTFQLEPEVGYSMPLKVKSKKTKTHLSKESLVICNLLIILDLTHRTLGHLDSRYQLVSINLALFKTGKHNTEVGVISTPRNIANSTFFV